MNSVVNSICSHLVCLVVLVHGDYYATKDMFSYSADAVEINKVGQSRSSFCESDRHV